ncbi:hypothetical protein AB6M99_08595 [Streptococcus hillyeri]|uniref:hypothetical protein n=1 Tax=Streptococcus hillyeri TaxID=2282420 RepID=UPI0034E2E9F9
MQFTYRVRRSNDVKFMIVAIFFMGIACYGLNVKNEWMAALPFLSELYYVILMFYGIILLAALARFLRNAPCLWGDSDFIYYTFFIFWRKKLSWQEIVSLRFEKETHWSQGGVERRMFMTIKSKNHKAIRFEITDWNVYRDDIIYDFQKQNPRIKLRY